MTHGNSVSDDRYSVLWATPVQWSGHRDMEEYLNILDAHNRRVTQWGRRIITQAWQHAARYGHVQQRTLHQVEFVTTEGLGFVGQPCIEEVYRKAAQFDLLPCSVNAMLALAPSVGSRFGAVATQRVTCMLDSKVRKQTEARILVLVPAHRTVGGFRAQPHRLLKSDQVLVFERPHVDT